jgi:phage replication O-like protein O
MTLHKSFMPVPNALAEALMRSPLTTSQWRVFVWALRRTLGWNRESTPFTWYRVANEIGLNRSCVSRAARFLVHERLVSVNDGRLRVQTDPTLWANALHRSMGARTIRKRCAGATLFRRPIDMVIDIKKKQRSIKKARRTARLAGAARPISGKYAHLTEA